MKTLLKAIVTVCCSCAIIACNPTQPTPPTKISKTAIVEEKIRNFKTDPSQLTMHEVEQALADLDLEIKELEVREAKAGGAEKDEITRKLSDLRAKYDAYAAEFTAARVRSTLNKAGEATGEALEKAGDAVKDAAQSVGDSLRSEETSR